MPVCIYCLATKPAAGFNTEHVLPRAFGRFRGALTLARPRHFRVCTDCNQHLGDSLDIALARNSMEALLRFQRGMLSPEMLAKLRYDRITVRLPAGHPFAPLLLRFVPNPQDGGIGCAPAAQLRISIGGGPPECVLEHQIATKLPALLAKGPVSNIGVFWWAGDPGADDRVREKAIAAGLVDRDWTAIVDESQAHFQQLDTTLEFTIDAIVARAIAKIAFEYFTWVVEPIARPFLEAESLGPIRQLISHGVGDWRTFVRPTNDPILATETQNLRHSTDHLLVLNWGPQAGAPAIVQVGLFNDLVYKVKVADPPALIWQSIDSGHHFRLDTAEVAKLVHSRLIQHPYQALHGRTAARNARSSKRNR